MEFKQLARKYHPDKVSSEEREAGNILCIFILKYLGGGGK